MWAGGDGTPMIEGEVKLWDGWGWHTHDNRGDHDGGRWG